VKPAQHSSAFLAAALAGALLGSGPAGAVDFSNAWFFGDSLSDTGNIARFTTSPGAIWTEVMAAKLGLTATPLSAGGTDYAFGGARIFTNTPPVQPVAAQVTAYLTATGGKADPSALYSVWGGPNDVFYAATSLPAASVPGYLYLTTAQEAGVIQALHDAGARYIIVPTLPDIGITPAAQLAGAGDAFTSLSTTYNALLYGQLSNAGLHVITPDTFSLTREIYNNPAPFGILNTSFWACSTANPPAGVVIGGAAFCNASTLNAPNADQIFMFADGIHPTTITHKIFGDYVYSIVVAPTAISMLAETPVRMRSGADDNVLRQAALGSGRSRMWIGVDAGRLEYGSGADVPAGGSPTGFSFGYDHDTRLGRVGVAVGGSQIEPKLTDVGQYTQHEVALSLYGSQIFGALNLGVAATLGHLDYHTRRDVVLGPTTRRVDGGTSGANVSLAALAQYTLHSGRLEHGPLLGMDLQHVDVSGFSESTAAGASTSMTFGSQSRNAFIGRVGYQLAWGSAAWVPYARASYEYDFASQDRSIDASLASVPGSGWSMPAVRVGRDAGNVALGSRWELAPGMYAWVELDDTFGRSEVTQYGARGGVSFGL
jgi:outer membrane lipase/esterase